MKKIKFREFSLKNNFKKRINEKIKKVIKKVFKIFLQVVLKFVIKKYADLFKNSLEKKRQNEFFVSLVLKAFLALILLMI